MFDVIVIGSGPSGMSAALNLLRSEKTVMMLEKKAVGGQIASSPKVENIPSIKEIAGDEFAKQSFQQLIDWGVEFDVDEVKSITKDGDIFKIETIYDNYEAKNVVIANGVENRKINIANEEEFVGKGIYYCAVCDGHFFKGEEVTLVGDGNSAMQYAIILAQICTKVNLCILGDEFFGEEILKQRIAKIENIKIHKFVSLKGLNGKPNNIESVVLEDIKTKKEITIPSKAAFIAIGQIPNNEIFSKLVELDHGYIVTDEKMRTKTEGLYAVGDTRVKDLRQVITAQNDGAIAAFEISKLG